MSTLAPDALLAQLRWRYATKSFDATRRIDPGTWQALAETLVLTPSSYGLQPWHFIAVTDPALKTRLRAVSWNQAQVEECSHHVVLTARRDMTEADVDRFVASIASVRGVPAASLAGYREMMVKDVVKGPRHAWVAEWAARQAYIALGTLMTAAAVLGIDACPMEGLDPAAYDRILGLEGGPYATVVACPLGYRAAGDKYAGLPKVRYPISEVVEVR